ncbi:MAG TPA: GNAT family N-acetyltransferase [Gaiellaceae bacterium]|nr:GNAT family N-acetyltransferase [Gaiellaceae bacterium]
MPTSSAPEDLRRFAEDPAAWGEIDPRSGLTRLLTDRYCLLLGPVPSFTHVSRLRLDPDEVPEAIAEVRSAVSARGHTRALWHVGAAATPADLADRLQAHGFVADDHLTSLTLAAEPSAGPPDVDARRVRDLAEFRLAASVSHQAFETPEDRQREWEGVEAERFAAERGGHGPRVYVAYLDGRPVGAASAIVEEGLPAALLVGGSVLPDARRRGVYRALVRARWDDAVAAGFGALCVQARGTSRPILERLGFEPQGELEVLLDPATC